MSETILTISVIGFCVAAYLVENYCNNLEGQKARGTVFVVVLLLMWVALCLGRCSAPC